MSGIDHVGNSLSFSSDAARKIVTVLRQTKVRHLQEELLSALHCAMISMEECRQQIGEGIAAEKAQEAARAAEMDAEDAADAAAGRSP